MIGITRKAMRGGPEVQNAKMAATDLCKQRHIKSDWKTMGKLFKHAWSSLLIKLSVVVGLSIIISGTSGCNPDYFVKVIILENCPQLSDLKSSTHKEIIYEPDQRFDLPQKIMDQKPSFIRYQTGQIENRIVTMPLYILKVNHTTKCKLLVIGRTFTLGAHSPSDQEKLAYEKDTEKFIQKLSLILKAPIVSQTQGLLFFKDHDELENWFTNQNKQ